MATEISKISDGSVGFLDKSGQLKSAEQNSKDSQLIDKVTSPERPTSGAAPEISKTTEFNDKSVSSALQFVRSRTNDQINNAAEVINTDRDNLQQAKGIEKEKINVLKDLKSAEKDGDDDKVKELKSKLDSLQADKAELKTKVDSDNQNFADRRIQTINVGNDSKGTVVTSKVEITAPDKIDVSSKQGIDAAIKQSQSEIDNINNQLSQNKESRNDLKSIAQEARGEIGSIEEKSIKSYEEATKLANDISSQLQTAVGAKAFEQATQNNLKPSVVEALLRY